VQQLMVDKDAFIAYFQERKEDASSTSDEQEESEVISNMKKKARGENEFSSLITSNGFVRYEWVFYLQQLELIRDNKERPTFVVYELITEIFRSLYLSRVHIKSLIKDYVNAYSRLGMFTKQSSNMLESVCSNIDPETMEKFLGFGSVVDKVAEHLGNGHTIVAESRKLEDTMQSLGVALTRERESLKAIKDMENHIDKTINSLREVDEILFDQELTDLVRLDEKLSTATAKMRDLFEHSKKGELFPFISLFSHLEDVSAN
jgi:hypothetical protein